MIVNTDYGMPLQPEKQYPRSETVDFQRGEVEWEEVTSTSRSGTTTWTLIT